MHDSLQLFNKSSKTYLNAHTHTHVRNLADPLLDMSDPSYSNGGMIMISPLAVFLPVAL